MGLSTMSASVRPSAAAFAVAAVDGCRDATCCWYEAAASDDDDGGGVSTAVVPTLDDDCSRLCTLTSDGPARPLGYPKAETPT